MNNLESEIAELQKMIEAKRDELEKAGGIVEEKDLVRESVGEMFSSKLAEAEVQAVSNQTENLAGNAAPVAASGESYVDHLDDQTAETVNRLIAEVSTKSIGAAVSEAMTQEPFVVDAFHDALVDKLYDELKARGIVS